jgi:hypothetical protein
VKHCPTKLVYTYFSIAELLASVPLNFIIHFSGSWSADLLRELEISSATKTLIQQTVAERTWTWA